LPVGLPVAGGDGMSLGYMMLEEGKCAGRRVKITIRLLKNTKKISNLFIVTKNIISLHREFQPGLFGLDVKFRNLEWL
jgi:hypothetical protein